MFLRSHKFKNSSVSPLQRLMIITQLCLAFSLMMWYIVQPFMGEYFNLRSRMLLYEYVMGTSSVLKEQSPQKLERLAQRFSQLSQLEQQQIKENYQQIEAYAQRPGLQKIKDGLNRLFQQVPPFEQAWIFFSITIAILILLKREGAKQAAWLLPLIVTAYMIDNQVTGQLPSLSPDRELFPTEETIIHNYLSSSLAPKISEQKKQLEKGWRLYLIDQWSSQAGEDKEQFLEEGEFNFTLARLKRLHSQSPWLTSFHEKLGLTTLSCYLLWNILFAWLISRHGFTTTRTCLPLLIKKVAI